MGLEEEYVCRNPWNKQQHDYWSFSMLLKKQKVDFAALCLGPSAVTYPLKATGRMWRSPLMEVQYLKCLMFVAFMESVSLNSPMPMPLQTVKRDSCSIYLWWIKKAVPTQAEAWAPEPHIVNSFHSEGALQVPGPLAGCGVLATGVGVGTVLVTDLCWHWMLPVVFYLDWVTH